MIRFLNILLVVVLGAPALAQGNVGLRGCIDLVSQGCCNADKSEDDNSESAKLLAACCCHPSPADPAAPQVFADLPVVSTMVAPAAVLATTPRMVPKPAPRIARHQGAARAPPPGTSLFAQSILLLV